MHRTAPVRALLFAAAAPLAACGAAPVDSQPAKDAVIAAFAQANPPGRTGLLLKGHSVWLEAPAFTASCLTGKDLAFIDDPRGRPAGSAGRITPTYENQRWLLKSTAQGYCVLLGADPKIELGEASYGQDVWRIDAKISMGAPSPWFECLDESAKTRKIEVRYDKEGKAEVVTDLSVGQGDCPAPLVGSEVRTGAASPAGAGGAAPTKAEVIALVKDFDKLLDDADHAGAFAKLSCVNLFATPPWGACAVSELLAVGPSFAAERKAWHGTPWLEYGLKSVDDIGAISKDAEIPGLFHVSFHHQRSDRSRSFSVQRIDGELRMFGVVERKAEGLTVARLLSDLADKDKRAVLKRRLAGEDIDAEGNSNKPEPEPAAG